MAAQVIDLFKDGNNDQMKPLDPVPSVIISLGVASVIICTVTGNLLVCLAVLLVRKLRHPANYLLISLAVSDFFVAVLVMPFAYMYLIRGSWQMGDALCNLWTCADVTLCTASILNLCAISVDRYWAITKPLIYATTQRTTKRILLYILCVWILALLISVLPVIALERPRNKGRCEVSQNIYYQIYATLFSFYGPTTIMLVLNYKIYQAARRLTRQDRASAMISINAHAVVNDVKCDDSEQQQNDVTHTREENCDPPSPLLQRSIRSSSRESNTVFQRLRRVWDMTKKRRFTHEFFGSFADPVQRDWYRREHKALTTLGLLMGAYIVCWLPFFLLALVKSICREHCYIPLWLDTLFLWLGYCNSMLNPLIYAKCNRDFRIPFRELLCCRYRTLKTVIRNELFTEKFGVVPENHRPETPLLKQHQQNHNSREHAHETSEIHCNYSMRFTKIGSNITKAEPEDLTDPISPEENSIIGHLMTTSTNVDVDTAFGET